MTQPTHEELINAAALLGIRDYLHIQIQKLRDDTSRGRVRNTARTRGYMEALQDIHTQISNITNTGQDK